MNGLPSEHMDKRMDCPYENIMKKKEKKKKALSLTNNSVKS